MTTSAARAISASRPGITISVRSTRYGRTIADGADHTIYLFTSDHNSNSTCYGPCATAWPPVLSTGRPVRGAGVAAGLGTTRRRDGRRQVTLAGHPLYYYVGDVQPGQILCQNVVEFGGTWLVVSPRGVAVR